MQMLELALANYKLALIDYELALIDYKLGSFQGITSHYLKQCWPMMTSSNGNIFRVTGHLCGEFTFPAQRPVMRSFDVFFDLRLNKRLSKQWWGW